MKLTLIIIIWVLAGILIVQNVSYTKIMSGIKNSQGSNLIENINSKDKNERTKNNENTFIQNNINTKKNNNTQKNNNTKKPKETKRSVAKVIGTLSIPDIEINEKNIYEGTELDILNIGIGHFTNTSICNGNVGLASHNSGGKGDEFKNLKNIKVGSEIYYKTKYDSKTYLVEIIKEISDEDWSYLSETNDNRITLLTCISGKPNSRLCVQGKEKI